MCSCIGSGLVLHVVCSQPSKTSIEWMIHPDFATGKRTSLGRPAFDVPTNTMQGILYLIEEPVPPPQMSSNRLRPMLTPTFFPYFPLLPLATTTQSKQVFIKANYALPASDKTTPQDVRRLPSPKPDFPSPTNPIAYQQSRPLLL